MPTFLIILLLGIVLTLSLTLLKVYKQVPEKELKRHARDGDALAEALFSVVSFGLSVDIFLWFLIGLSGGLLFVLLANSVALWLATIITALLIWFGFAWLPNSRDTILSQNIAKYFAVPLSKVLSLSYPLIKKIEFIINKYHPIQIHTGLYSREDLVDLLGKQKGQLDNRIPNNELLIAKNALTFSNKFVQDVMIPRRIIKSVNVTESIGPVLMEELHKTGHSRFPVYEGSKDNFVGIVYMRDMLKSRAGGSVKGLMEQKIYFVHDESKLGDVLQAFLKTHHHMFLVVNQFEEIVGLITLEDVLEQIIGKPIIDEFDAYEDLRAVAAKLAKKEHNQQDEVASPSSNASEVIE